MSKFDWVVVSRMGIGAIQYGPNNTLLHCGQDDTIRVLSSKISQGDSFDEYEEIHSCEAQHDGLNTMAVSPKNDLVATGSSNRTVALWDLPKVNLRACITRGELPIRHIQFSPSGTYLVVAADEPRIRVINANDHTQVFFLEGHDGPVKAVAFDPTGKYLASASNDGKVKIWNFETRKEEKSLDLLTRDLSGMGSEQDLSRLAWEPIEGRFLAIPTPKGVTFLQRNTWKIEFEFKLEKEANLIAWSPNGVYVAVAYTNQLMIWDAVSREDILKKKTRKPIISLDWHPKENVLAILDIQGQLCELIDVIPSSMPHPAHHKAIQQAYEQAKASSQKTVRGIGVATGEKVEKGAIGAPPVPTSRPQLSDLLPDDDELPSVPKSKSKVMKSLSDSEDEVDEMMNDVKEEESSSKRVTKETKVTITPACQSFFQPGATSDIEKKRRFLAWNMVGKIVVHQEGLHSSVEVEFADTTKHQPVRFRDNYNLSVAALGEHAAFFASQPEGQAPSTILYHPFDSWDTNGEWTLQVPLPVSITGVAIGSTFAAISTSDRMLRFFSVGGCQTMVMSTGGAVVCLAGYESYLAWVENVSAFGSSLEEPQLSLSLYNVKKKEFLVKNERVCLSEGATVQWMGFSETGLLVTYDSKGKARALVQEWGNIWSVVFDSTLTTSTQTDLLPSEYYWPIGLFQNNLIAIRCKKGEEPMPRSARALSVSVPLSIPLLHLSSVGGQLESRVMLSSLLTEQISRSDNSQDITSRHVEEDKNLLQLINLSCKADRSARAFDLASQLRLDRSIEIARTVADKASMSVLAERIDSLLEAHEYEALMEIESQLEEKKTKKRGRENDPDSVFSATAEPRSKKSRSDILNDAPARPAATIAPPPGGQLPTSHPIFPENEKEPSSEKSKKVAKKKITKEKKDQKEEKEKKEAEEGRGRGKGRGRGRGRSKFTSGEPPDPETLTIFK